MSRFIEVLNAHGRIMHVENISDILRAMQRKLNSTTAHLEMEFPYFMTKKAPVTRMEGEMDYNVRFDATACGAETDFLLTVKVAVTNVGCVSVPLVRTQAWVKTSRSGSRISRYTPTSVCTAPVSSDWMRMRQVPPSHRSSEQDSMVKPRGAHQYFMRSGSTKARSYYGYSSPLNSFWCCTGTGVESFAKLADSIFFHSEDGVYVNLFVPARLHWQEKGIILRMETRFPDDDRINLEFQCEKPAPLTIPQVQARASAIFEMVSIDLSGSFTYIARTAFLITRRSAEVDAWSIE